MSMHHIPITVIYANIILSKPKQYLLLLQWRSRFSDPIKTVYCQSRTSIKWYI